MSARVYRIHWIVVAIREHVIANDPLTGTHEDVGVDEAAHFGIVITAVQVVESRLLRIGLATRAKNSCFLLGPGKEKTLPGLFRFTVKRNKTMLIEN